MLPVVHGALHRAMQSVQYLERTQVWVENDEINHFSKMMEWNSGGLSAAQQ
jgi:hypothetical protein